MIIARSYFLGENVVAIARDLLGKELFTNINGKICSGIISETEAYAGITDKASHAYGNRRTKRTETMFQKGGRTYVYLCYGMHHLLNIVTAGENIPHAVLIRGIIPKTGEEIMLKRTNKISLTNISNGPAKLSKALGITTKFDNTQLNENKIWIEDNNFSLSGFEIIADKRIEIDYADEDAFLPYRFFLLNKK